MEFGLLGPLVVDNGRSAVTVSAGKQRVVLAALLLRAGQVVPAAELTRVVWDGRPPETARVTLQNYVMRLRQALGPSGYERIVTLPAGYLIQVKAGELDLDRFTRLAAAGRAAAAAGQWETASERLGAALALWRGPPLADVPSRVLAAQAQRLAGLRLDAMEARIDADLCLGRHRDVLPELQSLVAAEPLRERLCELLILALYRSGEQAEALAAYRRARRVLTERAGIEPGPRLSDLHQRVLRADPGLLPDPPPSRAVRGGLARLARPRQLPPGVAIFVGRSAELAALSAQAGRPAVITAIGGTAGVGKTALAVQWARQHARRFPDGQLYLNLRGFGPADPVPAADALRAFLDALKVPAEEIPAGLDGQQALYRSLLSGKRMLILLDNARDAEQVRPLLPATPTAQVLITSRTDLASLAITDGARQVSLDVLPPGDARQMVQGGVGAARSAAEPAAVAELIDLCARLPLALAITAARAAMHPSFPLSGLAAELRDARTRLDMLRTGGDDTTDLRAVFSWSCQHLSAPAARLFRLLGLHPGPDITAAAAASLAGIDAAQATRLLRELARDALLAEPGPGRYAFHDLLRVYAAEQAAAHEDERDRRQAIGRALDHYLHTAHAGALLLNPAREPVTLAPPRPGVRPECLAGSQQARDWFGAEHHVLRSAVASAAEARFDVHAWQLAWAVFTFLDGRGQWHEQAGIQRLALDAATRLADTAGQAVTLRNLAHNCASLGDYDQARAHLARCPGLYRELGDRAEEARVHQSLGFVSERQGRYGDALGHAEQALALFRAIADPAGQAVSLSSAGLCHGLLGDHERARTCCQQALALFGELGDRYGEAATWDNLGYAEHSLGRPAEAAACYGRAIELLGGFGDRVCEAEVLTRLGDAQHAANKPGAARDAWQQALVILDDLRHPEADHVRGKLRRLGPAHRTATLR